MARTPIHPGEILADELQEIGLTANKFADVFEVLPNRLYQIIRGKRSMTADTALRLGQYLNMSADFWMNLQRADELNLARRQNGKAIRRLPRREATESRPAAYGRMLPQRRTEVTSNSCRRRLSPDAPLYWIR